MEAARRAHRSAILNVGRVRLVLDDVFHDCQQVGGAPRLSIAIQARRFLSIRACTSAIAWSCGMPGRVSASASNTFSRNQVS